MSSVGTALEVWGLAKTLLPAVKELVELAENLFPSQNVDSGTDPGDEKKAFVTEGIDAVMAGMNVAEETATAAAPALSAVIDSVVSINNKMNLW